MVRWINKMIMKGKIHWSLNKISQLILKKLTWTSVWRTCKGILGIKGLKRRGQKYDFQNPGPWGNRFSNLFRWKWKCTQRYTPLIKRLPLVELTAHCVKEIICPSAISCIAWHLPFSILRSFPSAFPTQKQGYTYFIFLYLSLVRITVLSVNSPIVPDVLKGIVHKTSMATIVSIRRWTINQVLFTKRNKLASLSKVLAFQWSSLKRTSDQNI